MEVKECLDHSGSGFKIFVFNRLASTAIQKSNFNTGTLVVLSPVKVIIIRFSRKRDQIIHILLALLREANNLQSKYFSMKVFEREVNSSGSR